MARNGHIPGMPPFHTDPNLGAVTMFISAAADAADRSIRFRHGRAGWFPGPLVDPNMTPQKAQDRWKGPFEDTWWELVFQRISCIYRVTSCYFYNLYILKKLGRSKSQQVVHPIKCHCFFCVLSCFWALERWPSGAVRHHHVAAKAPVQHCQWLGNTVETWGNWVFWVMNIAILYNVCIMYDNVCVFFAHLCTWSFFRGITKPLSAWWGHGCILTVILFFKMFGS